mmetsp:Transcript_4409/g.7256  ORF Transcript_4409/g.7256 Transcript_4409/m.7256 type:complete len:217 (+) Transcript_4409:32-682(+)
MKGVVALVGLVVLVGLAQCFTMTIPARSEECFYETILKGTDVGMEFLVTSGGALDIDATVTGPPTGEGLYAARKETEGKYYFVTHLKGEYTFCFSNKMSSVTEKTVSVQINVGKQRSEEEIILSILSGRENDDDEEATIPVVSPLQSSILQLADGLHAVQGEEKYMRMRERAHRDTSESTNSRILYWSIFENVVLISISVWQVYYLKRFFEVKRAV